MEEWQQQHRFVIDNILQEINSITDKYILKGGTALMKCYGLDRFSEDIDLDGLTDNIIDLVQTFCQHNNYDYRVAKNTDTVKRCMIHYGGQKPLKVEVSYRRKEIPNEETKLINGIKVYNIDRLASMKASAYMSRDRIRDLYDVSFIVNNYYDELSEPVKNLLRDAISHKGLEQFDYLVNTQTDELIDDSALFESFLEAIDKLGILIDEDEMDTIESAMDQDGQGPTMC